MTTMAADMIQTIQVYQVYIKASPEQIWDAITKPEWNQRYGYGAPGKFDLRPGGAYQATPSEAMRTYSASQGFALPDIIGDGEIIECDPPRKLVQTWRILMDPQLAAEGFTRLTYEIAGGENGVSKLTVIHDLSGAPHTAMLVQGSREAEGAGGGWPWVLSDLKTLLETGAAFAG
jgi:uncharacterized protein YndB with AHSA1/START domain